MLYGSVPKRDYIFKMMRNYALEWHNNELSRIALVRDIANICYEGL